MDVNSEAGRRQQRVEKYFRKTPDPQQRTRAILLISASAFGGLLAIITLGQGGGFFGFFLLAAGGYGGYKGFQKKADYDRRYAAAEPKPSDEEMDDLLKKVDLPNLRNHAMKRLDLTRSDLVVPQDEDPLANLDDVNNSIDRQRDPWVVCGPEYRGFSLGPKVRAFSTVGRDGVCRFTSYDVMAICPTGYHLAVYQCTIDFLTGNRRNEETHEYHYADVVSVATKTKSDDNEFSFQPLDLRGGKRYHFEKALFRDFEIVVSSGDRSRIVVGIQDEKQPEEQVELQSSGIEDVIRSVRQMLKQKKGGVVGPAGQHKVLPPSV